MGYFKLPSTLKSSAENGAGFQLGIYLTILGLFYEFQGGQHLISTALVSVLLPDG